MFGPILSREILNCDVDKIHENILGQICMIMIYPGVKSEPQDSTTRIAPLFCWALSYGTFAGGREKNQRE
jgi:hypothetical protein